MAMRSLSFFFKIFPDSTSVIENQTRYYYYYNYNM